MTISDRSGKTHSKKREEQVWRSWRENRSASSRNSEWNGQGRRRKDVDRVMEGPTLAESCGPEKDFEFDLNTLNI